MIFGLIFRYFSVSWSTIFVSAEKVWDSNTRKLHQLPNQVSVEKIKLIFFECVKFLFFQICIYFSFRCTYNIHIFICYLLVSILYSTCLAILLTINFNYMWSLWMGFFSKHLWRDFLKAIQFLDIIFWLTGWVNNVDFKAAKALQVFFGRII